MIGLAANAAVLQASGEMAQKSLPYWMFWFLLSTILLLLAVIFLRDKDLRRRMSLFFSGARRKMLRLRLQAKLKKARGKKAGFRKELGEKAWSENIRPASAEAEKLAGLENEMHLQQRTWHEVYSRIESMGRQHEEAARRRRDLVRKQEELRKSAEDRLRSLTERKTRMPSSLAAAGAENEGEVRRLREERAGLDNEIAEVEALIAEHGGRIRQIEEEAMAVERAYAKSQADWLKNKQRVQDRIVEIRRLMEPLFERLGRALDEDRIRHDELDVLYFQIDNVDRTIEDLLARIDHLT